MDGLGEMIGRSLFCIPINGIMGNFIRAFLIAFEERLEQETQIQINGKVLKLLITPAAFDDSVRIVETME